MKEKKEVNAYKLCEQGAAILYTVCVCVRARAMQMLISAKLPTVWSKVSHIIIIATTNIFRKASSVK